MNALKRALLILLCVALTALSGCDNAGIQRAQSGGNNDLIAITWPKSLVDMADGPNATAEGYVERLKQDDNTMRWVSDITANADGSITYYLTAEQAITWRDALTNDLNGSLERQNENRDDFNFEMNDTFTEFRCLINDGGAIADVASILYVVRFTAFTVQMIDGTAAADCVLTVIYLDMKSGALLSQENITISDT